MLEQAKTQTKTSIFIVGSTAKHNFRTKNRIQPKFPGKPLNGTEKTSYIDCYNCIEAKDVLSANENAYFTQEVFFNQSIHFYRSLIGELFEIPEIYLSELADSSECYHQISTLKYCQNYQVNVLGSKWKIIDGISLPF